MHKEDTEPFSFEQQAFSLNKKLTNQQNNQPFKILYNARSTKTGKSRKSSASICNQNPMRLKKPRKMTLPLMEDKTSYQIEEVIYEVHSENNLPLYFSYEQNELFYQDYKQKIMDQQIDLENVIQFGIIEESDLDRQSWFQIRNQNPQFPLN